MNLKKILVPCDFSTTSYHAFDFAAEIASQNGSQLCVLHAVEFPVAYETTFAAQPYSFDKMALQDLEKDAWKNFEEMVERADAGVNATLSIDYGPVTQTIRNFITDQSVDLVVMGTHGASGFKEFFVGSNTEKIVRFSPVPVFSIKSVTHVSGIRNIVLPTQANLDKTEFIIRLKELQQYFNAKLHVLFVNTAYNFEPHSEIRKRFDEFAQFYSLQNFTFNIRDDKNEETGIMNFVYEKKADMIAMSTHGRKGLAHLLTGSLTEDIVNHVNCPIWTLTLKP